jgi:hypothetical protein
LDAIPVELLESLFDFAALLVALVPESPVALPPGAGVLSALSVVAAEFSGLL